MSSEDSGLPSPSAGARGNQRIDSLVGEHRPCLVFHSRDHCIGCVATERVAGYSDRVRVDGADKPNGFLTLRVEHFVDQHLYIAWAVECDGRAIVFGIEELVNRRVPSVIGSDDEIAVAGQRLRVVRVDVSQSTRPMGVHDQGERSVGRNHRRIGSHGPRRLVVVTGDERVALRLAAGAFGEREPDVDSERTVSGWIGDRDGLDSDRVLPFGDRREVGQRRVRAGWVGCGWRRWVGRSWFGDRSRLGGSVGARRSVGRCC